MKDTENIFGFLSEDAFVEQTEKIISALKDKNIERKPLVFDDSVLIWNDLDDGVYVAQNTGVIADNGDGLTLNKNDILLKTGDSAYIYAQSYASKIIHGHDGAYSSYSYSITAEQLQELIAEIYDGGSGGGAPAEHEHAVEDIYVQTSVGGAFEVSLSDISTMIPNLLKDDPEVVEWVQEQGTTIEDAVDQFCEFSGDEIKDSNNNVFYMLMLSIGIQMFKKILAPNTSLYNIAYGSTIKAPKDADEEDVMERVAIENAPADFTFSLGNKEYSPAHIENVYDALHFLNPSGQEDIDAIIEKFGNKTVTITMQMLDDDGNEFDLSNMSFADIMNDETLHDCFQMFAFAIIPAEDIAAMDGMPDDEANAMVKFHFGEIEPATVQKKALMDNLSEKFKTVNNTVHAMEDSINDVKSSNIPYSRVMETWNVYYGGDYHANLRWGNYTDSWDYESGFVVYFTPEKLNDLMTMGQDSSVMDRMKMGSVFELTNTDGGDPVYTYIGTASECGGLTYRVYRYGDDGEITYAEKFVSSLDQYLDEQGCFSPTKKEYVDMLSDDEVMFVTIIDSRGETFDKADGIQQDGVYCMCHGTHDPTIFINEVIPRNYITNTKYLSTELSDLDSRIRVVANAEETNFETAATAINRVDQVIHDVEQINYNIEELRQRYSNEEINNLISRIPKFDIVVVSSLPTQNISKTTVYLLAKQNTETRNLYTEYIYVNNTWEKIGEQVLDLSDYYKKQQTDSLVNEAKTLAGNAQTKANSAYDLAGTKQTAAQVQTAINSALYDYNTKSEVQTLISNAVANFLTESQIRAVVQEMIDAIPNGNEVEY